MDLDFSEHHEQFRAELRSWLDANHPGPPPRDMFQRFQFLKAWQRTLYGARWAAPHWPAEFGGRDADVVEQVVYHEEMARHGSPMQINFIGATMLGPTLIVHGTPEQKSRFLPKILSGDEIWCQGFSEPDAGSDLASLRTRAERRGDVFVVNGQKIWTSAAQMADWIFALVRTDPDAPKHDGISFLLIDLRSPGITVKPIRQISGDSEFCEIFFDDVEVPVEQLVGTLHRGWQIASTTLGHERGTAFLAQQIRYDRIARELFALARAARSADGGFAIDDPSVRQDLARTYAEVRIMSSNGFRGLTRVLKEGKAGPEGSINRVFTSLFEQRLHELAVRLQGPQGILLRGSPRVLEKGRWQKGYLRTRASTIGAGTSEIQRNIIAERVLGLPAEVAG